MSEIRYQGEWTNILLLSEEIEHDPNLAATCKLTVSQVSDPSGSSPSFRYGEWVEIAISVTTGVASNGIYDAIRRLVTKARNRGRVVEVGETNSIEEGGKKQDSNEA